MAKKHNVARFTAAEALTLKLNIIINDIKTHWSYHLKIKASIFHQNWKKLTLCKD